MAEQRKVRWGVIGAGGIADRRTIPGMMLADNAELVAVMEIDLTQAERLKEKYGAKRAYDSEAELLADSEVDAVYIASPVVLHAKQAKMAADAGKHILIEKTARHDQRGRTGSAGLLQRARGKDCGGADDAIWRKRDGDARGGAAR